MHSLQVDRMPDRLRQRHDGWKAADSHRIRKEGSRDQKMSFLKGLEAPKRHADPMAVVHTIYREPSRAEERPVDATRIDLLRGRTGG